MVHSGVCVGPADSSYRRAQVTAHNHNLYRDIGLDPAWLIISCNARSVAVNGFRKAHRHRYTPAPANRMPQLQPKRRGNGCQPFQFLVPTRLTKFTVLMLALAVMAAARHLPQGILHARAHTYWFDR